MQEEVNIRFNFSACKCKHSANVAELLVGLFEVEFGRIEQLLPERWKQLLLDRCTSERYF